MRSRASKAALGACLVLGLVGFAARARAVVHHPTHARTYEWRRVQLPNEGGAVFAVVLDRAGARLAVGDGQGLLLRVLEGSGAAAGGTSGWRRFAGTGPVRDLYLASSGDLWIASNRGLWRLDSNGRLERRALAPGAEAALVHRITGVPGLLVASTAGGAYLSIDGESWQRVIEGVPRTAVRAAAVRAWRPAPGAAPDPLRFELWLLVSHEAWRLEVETSSGELRIGPARRPPISGRPASQQPTDIGIGLPGAELAILYSRAIARILPGRIAEARWEVAYPVLPPGAQAARFHATERDVWLATDQGLLRAARLPGPWERVRSPAGSAPTYAVAGDGDLLYAATSIGLLEGRSTALDPTREVSGQAPGLSRRSANLPIDPDLRVVHERALSYIGLRPERFRALERGLSRRGWLPTMALRAGAAYDRDTSDDRDEAVSSGKLHTLYDSYTRRSRDFVGSITLSWDLAEVAYPSDAPELSREARQVVTLRDNVLDEVTQLYFDRQRVLVALSSFADRSDPEAVTLEIRSRELAAGLDAWTGGWFSLQVREPAH